MEETMNMYQTRPYKAADDRYGSGDPEKSPMHYRRCGRSGLMLPVLSLGLWHNFGEVDPEETAREMILYAFDHGITHFDLANNYGLPPGSAEACFGRILRNDLKPYRDELIISTKAGYRMWPGPYGEWGSRKYLTASLDQSLRRMGLDYVDIFYSHRPDRSTPLEETMSALVQAYRQGKCLYVGISSYSVDETAEAIAILKAEGVHCLIHQPSYSILNRGIEEGLLDLLTDKGVGCISFSTLAQGLLTDRYLKGIPADSRAGKETGFLTRDRVNETSLRIAKELNEVASDRGQTLAQMALAWALRHPGMTSLIMGASRTAQIADNLKALENMEFTVEELNRIDSILNTP